MYIELTKRDAKTVGIQIGISCGVILGSGIIVIIIIKVARRMRSPEPGPRRPIILPYPYPALGQTTSRVQIEQTISMHEIPLVAPVSQSVPVERTYNLNAETTEYNIPPVPPPPYKEPPEYEYRQNEDL